MTAGRNVKRAMARRPSPPIDAKLALQLDADHKADNRGLVLIAVVYFVSGWFAGVLTVAFWRWAVPS